MRTPSGIYYNAGLYHSPAFLRAAGVISGSMWALKNGGTKTLVFRYWNWAAFFDGVPVGNEQAYELRRFTGAAAALGTALTPQKSDPNMGISSVADLRVSTGAAALTAPGAIDGASRITLLATRQLSQLIEQVLPDGFLVVPPSEGLEIQLSGNTVVGDNLVINCAWEEI